MVLSHISPTNNKFRTFFPHQRNSSPPLKLVRLNTRTKETFSPPTFDSIYPPVTFGEFGRTSILLATTSWCWDSVMVLNMLQLSGIVNDKDSSILHLQQLLHNRRMCLNCRNPITLQLGWRAEIGLQNLVTWRIERERCWKSKTCNTVKYLGQLGKGESLKLKDWNNEISGLKSQIGALEASRNEKVGLVRGGCSRKVPRA